jgi:hypothetical protein
MSYKRHGIEEDLLLWMIVCPMGFCNRDERAAATLLCRLFKEPPQKIDISRKIKKDQPAARKVDSRKPGV